MRAQMLAADGQDHAGVVAVGDGNQHRSGNFGLGAKLREVAVERRFGGWQGQRFPQALSEAQPSVPSG